MRTLAFSFLFLLATATRCPRAHAQYAELYGTVAINHLSSVELLPYSSSQFSTYTPVGGTIGGTFNFINFHVVNVGIDGRYTAASGANIFLGGFQVAAKSPVLPIKPYFRLSVGRANLHVPQSASSSIPNPVAVDYYLYNAALGVDYKLTRFLDIRAIEIGDGRTLGGGSSNPTSFLTINTGIVLHTF